MEDRWLSFAEAVELVRAREAMSIGRAEATVRRARESGEVRSRRKADPNPVYLLAADDGILSFDRTPGAGRAVAPDGKPPPPVQNKDDDLFLSKEDLTDWLDRQQPQPVAPKKAGKKRERAEQAIGALWPDGTIPDQAAVPNDVLCKKVAEWLKADCAKRQLPFAEIGKDTVLRAAGRK